VEELLAVLIVVVSIVSTIKKNQKKRLQEQGRREARQAQAAAPQGRAPYSMESLQQWFEEEAAARPAEKAQPAVPAGAGFGGSIREMTHEGIHPCDEHTAVPQPRIQTRVQVTEKPAVVVGSMGVDTHEGIHPCDEHEDSLLQSDKPLVSVPVEKPGIQLDWTGDNMVKAFIMQEVLTRPSQRRRA